MAVYLLCMNQQSPNKRGYPSKLQQSRQHFQDLLNCQICYCKASQPTLCPHCSKIYCQLCIMTSLKVKPQCPNCRKIIKGQLTNCTRFLSQLSNIINSIFKGHEQAEKCSQHGISLNYFCQDCLKSVCCECKIFGEHQTHQFKAINAIYQAKYQSIRDLLSELRGKLVSKQELLTNLQNCLIELKGKAESRILEIEDYTEKCCAKMNNQSRDESQEFEDIDDLKRRVEQFNQIKNKLFQNLQNANRTNCYRHDQQTFDRLDNLLTKNKEAFEGHKNISAMQEAIPAFVRFKVTIQNYSKRKEQKQPFYSEIHEYEQSQWRLVVYLKGNSNNHYCSVFLQLLYNPDEINLYAYQIQLIHPKNIKNNILKEHHSKFNLNQCCGYGKFIKVQQLHQQGYISQSQDSLTFFFGVRCCNYFDLYKRRQSILNRIDNLIQKKQTEIQVFETQVEKASQNSIKFQ